jgi:hypothetical protein
MMAVRVRAGIQVAVDIDPHYSDELWVKDSRRTR